MDFLSLVGIALISCVLIITIRPYQPVFAFAISLAAGIFLLLQVGQTISELLHWMRLLAEHAGITSELYLPVMKIVGISMVIRLSSAICKDAGQQALATKLELIGCITSLVLCFPLVQYLVELIRQIST